MIQASTWIDRIVQNLITRQEKLYDGEKPYFGKLTITLNDGIPVHMERNITMKPSKGEKS